MDRYLHPKRTRLLMLLMLASIVAYCSMLTTFADTSPKQETAQGSAPVTVENFGQVNIGYIPANKTQKQENEKTWGPSRRFEPRKIMRGQCNTLSVIEYHTSSQHLRSQPRAAQAVSSQLSHAWYRMRTVIHS